MFINDAHPSFVNKPEGDVVVWRYMDLARFMSILESKTLNFTRADFMADKWEGSYSYANVEQRPGRYGEHFEMMIKDAEARLDGSRKTMFLNCWHVSNEESAAMWDIYQREGRGVAIKTTWGRLTSSLKGNVGVYGAYVNYVDYKTTFISETTTFDPFLHKRLSFAHEKEARLIFMEMKVGQIEMPHGPENAILGYYDPAFPVPIDVEELIEVVYIAPDTPSWISDLVTSIVKTYGYEFTVRQSDLANDPIA
ncbi:hypothetical protein [Subtercola sp. RTI3]|uniref:hypothetical protein n=1 Tax=Subtercola sp. RTI3 TaxID=3048639 RepID=UPI002B229519|nr:hypothetical protein [Subtercola sp. RTI3]MEA9985663.1 hypothetical protein [Subtercola sp. RTI3]